MAEIWDKWATKDSIIKAAQRVGIASSGLDINKMQQDKFAQAAKCMENDEKQPPLSTLTKHSTRSSTTPVSVGPLTPKSLIKLAKTKHRYGSASYWQFMYEQFQQNVKDCYENSLKLDAIPGLLTINKVKPKDMSKKTTRITNIHWSMEAQDILSKVESIEKEKEQKQQGQLAKKEQKEKEKELFYRCKTKCVCEGTCAAKNLKECPNCHSVMKSVCSKAACQIDGKRPVMICPATSTATNPLSKPKRKLEDSSSEEDDDDSDDVESSSSGDDLETDDYNDDDVIDEVEDSPLTKAISVVKEAWKSVSPPISEGNIIGKWYGVVYRGGKMPMLYVAKVLRRFLTDENGPVDKLEMECLMPKYGSGNILQAGPSHLPPDISQFALHDIIKGPLIVIPIVRMSRSFEVKDYDELKSHFQVTRSVDLKNIK